MSETRAKAIKFFEMLAAGAPLRNVTWGKSEREIRDYYLLAKLALEKEQLQAKSALAEYKQKG